MRPRAPIIRRCRSGPYAVPFDADRLAVTGPPVRLVDGVAVASATGGAQFDVSANGLLVYALADEQAVDQG